jgi:hypothetical protein
LSRVDWINSQAVVDTSALAAGDGYQQEEAKALCSYLPDNIGLQEAAEKIVSPIQREADPPSGVYRFRELLPDALVELTEHREKLLGLLTAIYSLPPHVCIDWSRLADFGHMWSDVLRLHFHGRDRWEKGTWTDARKFGLRHHFEAIDRAEAVMVLRGICGIPA